MKALSKLACLLIEEDVQNLEISMAEEENTDSDESSGKKKTLLFIIIALVLVLLLSGVGIFLFLSSGADSAEEKTISSGETGEVETSAEADAKAGAESDVKSEESKSKDQSSEEPESEAKNDGSGSDGQKKDEEAKSDEAKGKGDAKAADSTKEEETYGFGETYKFKTFHLNLGNALENRFVRLEVALEFSGGEAQKKEIERRSVQLRDAIISVITRKTREFILSPDGKDALRKEILIRINRYMTKKIDSVYITDILIE